MAGEPYSFDGDDGFLDSCRQYPLLSSVKLKTERRDVAARGDMNPTQAFRKLAAPVPAILPKTAPDIRPEPPG
jgi:hypothetical protein